MSDVPPLLKRSAVLLVLLCVPLGLQGQTQRDSPVFKRHKPSVPPLLEQPDIVYEIWQAFTTMRKANAGDVMAEHELGLRYLSGRGVEADTVKAAYWIQKAAEHGLLPAVFNLGILAFYGWGVPWDPFESYRLFRSCADREMAEAQYVMVQFYTENFVVPQNPDSAYAFARRAAAHGYKPAQAVLQEFAKRGYGADSAANGAVQHGPWSKSGLVFFPFEDDTARQLTDRSLLRNVLTASGPELTKALGITKILERNLEVDSARMRVIREAAAVGSPEALTVLGRCHELGVEVVKDPVIAAMHYIRAVRMDSPRSSEMLWLLIQQPEFFGRLKARAGEGDPDASFVWAGLHALEFNAQLLQSGAYIPDAQALQFLRSAAEKDHIPSLIELGLCFYSGRWVQKEPERAMGCWKQAAALGGKEGDVRIAVIMVRDGLPDRVPAEAVRSLEAASKEGSVLADVALGFCYEAGAGVPQQASVAVRLYRAAAQRGSQEAYRALRRMHDEIRPSAGEFRLLE